MLTFPDWLDIFAHSAYVLRYVRWLGPAVCFVPLDSCFFPTVTAAPASRFFTPANVLALGLGRWLAPSFLGREVACVTHSLTLSTSGIANSLFLNSSFARASSSENTPLKLPTSARSGTESYESTSRTTHASILPGGFPPSTPKTTDRAMRLGGVGPPEIAPGQRLAPAVELLR